MFANNEKISIRQLERLLCLDWTAKFCLLLPVILKPLYGWGQILALVLGAIWASFYARILGRVSVRVGQGFTGYMSVRLGTYAAYIVGILFFGYMLLNQIYLARAAGRLCKMFLLPEMKETVLGILYLTAGLAAAVGSVQKRARSAQCLYPLVAAVLIVMLAASADSIKFENLRWDYPISMEEVLRRSACVFAAFSGMGVVLYEVPYINLGGCEKMSGEKRRAANAQIGRGIEKSIIYTAVFLTATFLVMLGAFGGKELIALPWPVLVLMSNVNIPGGFLQRWDIVFLSTLLLGLLTASGTGIHYMGRIWGELFPRMKREAVPWYMTAISIAAILLVGDYETAQKLFAKWALCAMMPLMTVFPVLLWILEKVNDKRLKQRGKEKI